MSADELDRICTIIIGREWQRPLARILGAFHPAGERDSIDDRLVRRWASGAREMPVWAVIALGLIAERRLPPFRQRVIEMEKIVQDFESSRVAYPANLVEFLEYRADTPWQNRIGDTP